MALPVTTLYASLLALWLLVLSARVIMARRGSKVSLGHGDEKTLERRIRAHGNLTEYVPICLILMGLLEVQGAGALWLHILGLTLLIGRLLHGYALSFTTYSPLRVPGMLLTLTSLSLLALANLFAVLF